MADKRLANFMTINKSLINSSTLSITKHLKTKLKPSGRIGGKIRLSDKLDANEYMQHNFQWPTAEVMKVSELGELYLAGVENYVGTY